VCVSPLSVNWVSCTPHSTMRARVPPHMSVLAANLQLHHLLHATQRCTPLDLVLHWCVQDCRQATYSETCHGAPNQCTYPPQGAGPTEETTFGQCLVSRAVLHLDGVRGAMQLGSCRNGLACAKLLAAGALTPGALPTQRPSSAPQHLCAPPPPQDDAPVRPLPTTSKASEKQWCRLAVPCPAAVHKREQGAVRAV